MARLPYVDRRSAPEPVRDALERLPDLNIFRMTANAETLFRPFLALGTAILGTMKLDAKLRELVILHVGRLSRGEYEWVQHVPIAEALGATAEQIAALERDDLEADCFDVAERATLRLTTEIVRETKASDATFVEAAKHLSPREIVELIVTIGFYMTIARLTETTGIEIDGPAGMQVVEAAKR